jgi:hypothetical protein
LTWYRDSKPLAASSRVTPSYDLNTCVSTLKIDNAQMQDIGHYTVIASNEAGQDRSECKVFVDEMPSIDTTPSVDPSAFRFLEHPVADRTERAPDNDEQMVPPKVIVPLSNVKMDEGRNIVLAFKVIGSPKPKVRWNSTASSNSSLGSRNKMISFNFSRLHGSKRQSSCRHRIVSCSTTISIRMLPC